MFVSRTRAILAKPDRAGRRGCLLASADSLTCLASSGPMTDALSFGSGIHHALAHMVIRSAGAATGLLRPLHVLSSFPLEAALSNEKPRGTCFRRRPYTSIVSVTHATMVAGIQGETSWSNKEGSVKKGAARRPEDGSCQQAVSRLNVAIALTAAIAGLI